MISVIMSVYNEKLEWLSKAVESILNQTYKDFEYIIIIDNPNLDKSAMDYLENKATNDARIRIRRNEKNIGLMNSLNVGIKLAKGEIIARMDADDISLPDRFERELKFMQQNNFDLVSGNRIDIDENGKEIGRAIHVMDNPQKHLPYTNFIVHPSVMVRTDVMRELGGYRGFYNSEDYDMWLRILSAGYSIGVIKDYLVCYRIRQSSMSLKNKLETYYITKYQQRLYRERKKTGTDSYTFENFKKYMDSKNISESKNRRYCTFRDNMDLAITKLKSKNIGFVGDFCKAFIAFPSAAIDNISTIMHIKPELFTAKR